MRQETRSPSNLPEKAPPPKPRLPREAPALPGKKALAASEAYSLTALMIEYRSWWNLPRSKSRKSRP